MGKNVVLTELTLEQKKQRLEYIKDSLVKAEATKAVLTQQLLDLNNDAEGTHGEDMAEAATAKAIVVNNLSRCIKSIDDYKKTLKVLKEDLGIL